MGLYKGEERRGEDRRREDRRGEDRRREDRGGEDRRREDRRRDDRRREDKIRKRRSRKRTLFWLLIILFVSLVFSAFIGTIDVMIEKYFNIRDDSYRPMDSDRMRYELEKAKPVGKK